MECQKCNTSRLIQEVLAKYPKGDAPEEVLAPLRKACLDCSHGCSSCKTVYTIKRGDKKEKYEERTLDYRAKVEKTIAKYGGRNAETTESLVRLRSIVEQADSPNSPYTDEDYAEAIRRLRAHEELADARSRLLRLDRRCANCTRSADDNPSNHGQIFVSLDSGEATGGKESVESRSDWMLSNMDDEYKAGLSNEKTARDEHDSSLFRKGMTNDEIEESLRNEFINFLDLDEVDKLLCVMLMSKKKDWLSKSFVRFYTIADFAKMEWVPECMQFQNGNGPYLFAALKDIVDYHRRVSAEDAAADPSAPALTPEERQKRDEIRANTLNRLLASAEQALYGERATRKGITKQAAHARFLRIVKKMPILMAVAHGTIGKGGGGGAGRAERDTTQLDFGFFD